MSIKKWVPVLLASVMSTGLLAGCNDSGSTNTPSPSVASSASPSASASTSTSLLDSSNRFAQTVNLDIPVYDRAFEGWNVADNYYTRWIQKEFGEKHNVKVNFVPISRSNEVRD